MLEKLISNPKLSVSIVILVLLAFAIVRFSGSNPSEDPQNPSIKIKKFIIPTPVKIVAFVAFVNIVVLVFNRHEIIPHINAANKSKSGLSTIPIISPLQLLVQLEDLLGIKKYSS